MFRDRPDTHTHARAHSTSTDGTFPDAVVPPCVCAGGTLDYYAPWRHPGAAPVIDACGVAGGRLPGQGAGTAGADYMNTSNAKLGDKGSMLPPLTSGVVWTAGSVVDVAWTVKAFHGGVRQQWLTNRFRLGPVLVHFPALPQHTRALVVILSALTQDVYL